VIGRRKKRETMPEGLPEYIFERDKGCVAARVDPEHVCLGRPTLEHVPELGKNALGKKPCPCRFHLLTLCYGANSGGTRPWGEMHRAEERAWISSVEGSAISPGETA
jgi:hypothetical protein